MEEAEFCERKSWRACMLTKRDFELWALSRLLLKTKKVFPERAYDRFLNKEEPITKICIFFVYS